MATLDNYPRPAQQTDVGLKISKPGYDAMKTTGSNYVFDSSWPTLPIAYQTTITSPSIPDNTYPATLATHNLGFPPLTFIWIYYNDPGVGGMVTQRWIPDVDSTSVYNNQSMNLAGSSKVHITCFNLDLTKDVDYTLAPGDTFKAPYDPNFGIKVTKENKDINSKDMRDFILHSRCQSPLILAVKTEQTANTANPTYVQYTNKLPYQAWVYGFIRKASNQRYRAIFGNPQGYPSLGTNGFVSTINYNTVAGDDKATLVVLRDPFFAANQLTVQY